MVREMAAAFREVMGVEPTPEQLTTIQSRIIQEFGGERVYVPKRIARPAFVVGALAGQGNEIRFIMRTYRVSYTTAWRMLRRR